MASTESQAQQSPFIYTGRITGVDLSRPIGDQGVLEVVSNMFLYLPLPADLVHSQLAGCSGYCINFPPSLRLALGSFGSQEPEES